MKKKIGEIYNKPIVTGDKNLVTKNEIHESSLGGSSSGGTSDEYEYYTCRFDNLHTWAIRVENEDVISGFDLIHMLCGDFTWAESNYMGMHTTFHYHATTLTGDYGWAVFMKVPKYINKGTIDAYSNEYFIFKNKNLIDSLTYISTIIMEALGVEGVEGYESNIENIISEIKMSSYEEMYDNYEGYINLINNV